MNNVIKTVAKSILVPLGLTGVVYFGSLWDTPFQTQK